MARSVEFKSPMKLCGALLGVGLLVPLAANAGPAVRPSGQAAPYDFVIGKPNIDELQFARQVVPATQAPDGGTSAVVAQSRTIYLNKNGVTLAPGNNDSRANRSSIATQTTQIPPWNVTATTWNATVACVRELFAPFNVTVVETDPGNVPHIEAVFGGSPSLLGLPAGVAGVSPFTTDCSIIENSVVFTFTNAIPQDARLACEIQAQEIAHSFGLDHELLASDPMTYLNYNGNRTFKNQAAQCGEDVQRPCGINGSVCRQNQNSVTLLTERLGAKAQPGDTTAPSLNITSPRDGATVPPGFTLMVNATDNVGVRSATLYTDGAAGETSTIAPFSFQTPVGLSEGQHTFKVIASDGTNEKAQQITVTVRKGAPQPVPPAAGDGGGDDSDVIGGCSAGGGGGLGGAGLGLGLGLLGLAFARRRR